MAAVLAFSPGSSPSHSIALYKFCFISSLLMESSIVKLEEGASSTVERVTGTLSNAAGELGETAGKVSSAPGERRVMLES